ncbi:MAG: hypothetical protein O7G85_13140, partial [Planctomycetota bacterium]|nr:hypothetical protein [Planctomycetota bacterium]
KKKAKAQTSKGGSNDEETLRAALDTLIQFLPPVYRDEPGKLERALLTHYGMQRPGFMSDLEASYFSLCEEHMLSPQATGEYVRGEIQKALQIVADLWKH